LLKILSLLNTLQILPRTNTSKFITNNVINIRIIKTILHIILKGWWYCVRVKRLKLLPNKFWGYRESIAIFKVKMIKAKQWISCWPALSFFNTSGVPLFLLSFVWILKIWHKKEGVGSNYWTLYCLSSLWGVGHYKCLKELFIFEGTFYFLRNVFWMNNPCRILLKFSPNSFKLFTKNAEWRFNNIP
jgi:hypothetical protein